MFHRHHRKAKLLFGLSDAVLTCLAFELAYFTRKVLPFDLEFFLNRPIHFLLLGVAISTWVLLGYGLSIYERLETASQLNRFVDVFRQIGAGLVALVITEYLFRLDLSRSFLLIFAVYASALLLAFRMNAEGIARRMRAMAPPSHVLVAGTGERAVRFGHLLERSSDYGIRLLGFLSENTSNGRHITLQQSYPVYPLDELRDVLERHVVDEIIFAVDSPRLAELEEVFLFCDEEGVRTRVVVDFFPHVNSEISLDRLGSAPLLTFTAAPDDELRLTIKRAADILLASVALILLSPMMAVLAIIIKLTSPGPVIFRQVRCGLNGRRFVFYKFRSMCDEAEALKAALAHLNVKQTAFKIPDDPRITPIGRYMRKFSIDEWPQLWNVLRGDMSMVGPRPAVPEEVERYKTWQRRRLRMRPGLTCLWAISGRDHLDFDTWMRLDMQYIDNWSLALDWRIILHTIPQVILGKGAH
ncbi:MAG TPA: sugar transferase [Bryobacteraceae bacterium]|nr:sugar transferase [Bryobacteraceae bacterium]